ncbi:hypothetical protein ACJJTC_005117 [Scirpophaga incertulas]
MALQGFAMGGDGGATDQRADERARMAVRHVRGVHHSARRGAHICADDLDVLAAQYRRKLAWAFSTVLGLFLFLVEIAILCWVKFWDYSFAAATAATVIVIPVLIVFVAFAIHFYHSLVVQKCETSVQDIEQLESMKRDLDTATVKVNMF